MNEEPVFDEKAMLAELVQQNARLISETKPDGPNLPSLIENEETKLKVVERLLASEKSRVQVRGFELARLHPSGEWEQVLKYRDNQRALAQAKSDCTWLNERHPGTLYQVRVLVSAQIPDPPKANDVATEGVPVDSARGDGEPDSSGGRADGGAAEDAGPEVSAGEAPGSADDTQGSTPSFTEEVNA